MKGANLDGGLGGGREGAFSAFASGAQPADGAQVARHVLLVFALELIHEVGHHARVDVLAAQVRVARRRAHLEHRALVDCQTGHVQFAATEVEYQQVQLAPQVLFESISDRSCRWLVDKAQQVETSDGAC